MTRVSEGTVNLHEKLLDLYAAGLCKDVFHLLFIAPTPQTSVEKAGNSTQTQNLKTFRLVLFPNEMTDHRRLSIFCAKNSRL